MFVINLLPLLLGFLGPSAESPCLPINQGLLDSNISNVFCKYNGLESASAIAEGTSCSVQCRLKNLEKLFHCWKSGWNEVPHDDFCTTGCQHPGLVHTESEWVCPTPLSHFHTGTICRGECTTDSSLYEIICGWGGRWYPRDGLRCQCSDVSLFFPNVDWFCSSIPDRDQMCRGGCRHWRGIPEDIFEVRCGLDGAWKIIGRLTPDLCPCQDPHVELPNVAWSCHKDNLSPGSICKGTCHVTGKTQAIKCLVTGQWIVIRNSIESDFGEPEPCGCLGQLLKPVKDGVMVCNEGSDSSVYQCHLRCKAELVPFPQDVYICRGDGPMLDVEIRCEAPVIFVVGGIDENGNPLKSIEVFSPYDDNDDCSETIPELPMAFALSFSLWFRGSIMICGSEHLRQLPTCYLLVQENGRFHFVPFNNVVKGCRSSATYTKGHAIFVGGLGAESAALKEIYAFNGFTQLTSKLGPLPFGIYDHCALVIPPLSETSDGKDDRDVDDGLLVVGGVAPGMSNWTHWNCLIRIGDQEWSRCPSTQSPITSPSCALTSLGIFILNSDERKIHWGKIGANRTVDWVMLDNKLLSSRQDASLVPVENGTVVVIGGDATVVELIEPLGDDEFQIVEHPKRIREVRRYASAVAVPKSFCSRRT